MAKRSRCSVQKALAVVGERWSLLIVRELFYGVRRFDELKANVGCATNMLTARLTKLVDAGVLERRPYADERGRTRDEYRLTEKGHELFPVMLALLAWGDRWEQAPGAGPVRIEHECGAELTVELRCRRGHQVTTSDEARAVFATSGGGARTLPLS